MKISPDSLVCLDVYCDQYPIRIDLVYAQADHKDNIFKTAIYKSDAKLWCHKDLAEITLKAAEICYKETGYIFEIKDSLRPVEAQEKMQDTDIVRANPHWCEQPNRLLSPPGGGGHPRGMAIDIILVTENGDEVDMGTSFDHLSEDPMQNPAARAYIDFDAQILQNRQSLESAMLCAAHDMGRELLPLPQEWWDFRFPSHYTKTIDPIFDKDLPLDMRMVI